MNPEELQEIVSKLETDQAKIEAAINRLKESEETTDEQDEEIDGLESLSMVYSDTMSQIENLIQHISEE